MSVEAFQLLSYYYIPITFAAYLKKANCNVRKNLTMD